MSKQKIILKLKPQNPIDDVNTTPDEEARRQATIKAEAVWAATCAGIKVGEPGEIDPASVPDPASAERIKNAVNPRVRERAAVERAENKRIRKQHPATATREWAKRWRNAIKELRRAAVSTAGLIGAIAFILKAVRFLMEQF